ncbi:MAG: PDZ domain-containing protein [Deltaproteobacteria bacterium]|nr:PDZ domain-containing protein [Deltaproteobacteria bacterium]
MNGRLGLIHSVLPATVDLQTTVPESHPSARNLGTERMGSGTFVDSDGYILTVNYVVNGADSISVTTFDGESLKGDLAAQDPETGLALVKVPGQDFPYMRPSPAEELAKGQAAFIVASTGNRGRRVSGGFVTSLDPYDGQWEYLLEKGIHLSNYNPGFGGGTLVDFKGHMMGVCAYNLNELAKFSLSIPIEFYLQNEQELKQFGRVQSRAPRPWLGIYAQLYGGHLVISGVSPGGPAAEGGLKEGDIILGVEDKPVKTRPELYREMWKKRPGEKISFKVLREEESVNINVIGVNRREYDRTSR